MQEIYGVMGSTNDIEPSIVVSSLGDISTKVMYIIPWYGNKKVSTSMETIYDWLLDNEASFKLVINTEGRTPPKILIDKAVETLETEDVDNDIMHILNGGEIKGIALLVWDEAHPERSIEIATACVEAGIPSLELTNGLSPIIIDDVATPESTVSDDELPSVGDMSFDKETLDVMPAASVKRMARDAGHDVKTKDEAIKALTNKSISLPDADPEVAVTILVMLNNGLELGFTGNQELLNKIFAMVVKDAQH